MAIIKIIKENDNNQLITYNTKHYLSKHYNKNQIEIER